MSALSPLSRAYLEFIQDIRAGERALADDIGRILEAVAHGRSDGTAVTATTLERRREVEGVVFTLRTTWDPREGWPVVTFEAKGDTGLFDVNLLRGIELVQPDRDALLADATTELRRTWDDNSARMDPWFEAPDTRERLVALSILREVSRRLRGALRPKPGAITQNEGKVSGYTANVHFPAYVEWYDQDTKTDRRISWEITYHFETRPNRPAGLHLVCYFGHLVPHLFEGQPFAGVYVIHPILASWPEQLAAVSAGQETAAAAATHILSDTSAIYARYRARLDGVTP